MKFLQVDPDSVEAQAVTSARGGIIGPIIEGFLKTGYFMVEIPADSLKEIGRKAASVSASVAAYSKNHIRPVRPVLRQPKLFLQRRDIDKDGNEVPDWKDALLAMHTAEGMPDLPVLTIESVSISDQKKAAKK